MESSSPPPWVTFILEEMNRRFDSLDKRLDKSVSTETFRDEQARVNMELKELSAAAAKNSADIQAEANARVAAELARAQAERGESERRQELQRQTRWQWFLIPASPIAVLVVGWLANGGLASP